MSRMMDASRKDALEWRHLAKETKKISRKLRRFELWSISSFHQRFSNSSIDVPVNPSNECPKRMTILPGLRVVTRISA